MYPPTTNPIQPPPFLNVQMSTSRYLKEEKAHFDVHQPALAVSVVVYAGLGAAFWTSDAALGGRESPGHLGTPRAYLRRRHPGS
jgi:hypothetical protein